jgi:peptidoglycan/xylan/chitin deacetylase (PgdA/CDA1 family)
VRAVRVLSLTLHDVVAAHDPDSSGFPGPSAAHYKLTPAAFAAHLEAIAGEGLEPSLVTEPTRGLLRLHLTFDDGGSSALDQIAPELGRRSWRAHFFVTTGELDAPAFLRRSDLAQLAGAGHLVGSHAHTHRPLTRLAPDDLREELRSSKAILEDVLGEPVSTLAAPGGFSSARVAAAAAEEGYAHLFTSEPWLQPRTLDALTLYGRFALVAGSPAAETAALCRLSAPLIWRKRAGWTARKSARRALGPVYAHAREAVFARGIER